MSSLKPSSKMQLLPAMHIIAVNVGGRQLLTTDLNKLEVNEGLCRVAAKMALGHIMGDLGASPDLGR